MYGDRAEEKIFLEVTIEVEFISWAFKEPATYRNQPDVLDRMNTRVYCGVASEFRPERNVSRGNPAIILDRAVCVGWRFVEENGRPVSSWSVARDRHTAVASAYAEAREMDYQDPNGASYVRALEGGRARIYRPAEPVILPKPDFADDAQDNELTVTPAYA